PCARRLASKCANARMHDAREHRCIWRSRSDMKGFLAATAVLLASLAVYIGVTLPAARLTLPGSSPDGTIPGILHIHTNRSDGRDAPEDIAEAARRAGLKFIVL